MAIMGAESRSIGRHRTDGTRVYVCVSVEGRRYKLIWVKEQKGGMYLGSVRDSKRHTSYHRDGVRNGCAVQLPKFSRIEAIEEALPVTTVAFGMAAMDQIGKPMTEQEPGEIIDLGDATELPPTFLNIGACISRRTQTETLERMIWNYSHVNTVAVRSFPLHYFEDHDMVVFALVAKSSPQ